LCLIFFFLHVIIVDILYHRINTSSTVTFITFIGILSHFRYIQRYIFMGQLL